MAFNQRYIKVLLKKYKNHFSNLGTKKEKSLIFKLFSQIRALEDSNSRPFGP